MGSSYTDMKMTPDWVIQRDLEIIDLDNYYRQQATENRSQ